MDDAAHTSARSNGRTSGEWEKGRSESAKAAREDGRKRERRRFIV